MSSKQSSPDARSKAESAFTASQQRDEAVKQEIAKEQAKVNAKTAKLRALRLAKEAADRAAAPPESAIAALAPKRGARRKAKSAS